MRTGLSYHAIEELIVAHPTYAEGLVRFLKHQATLEPTAQSTLSTATIPYLPKNTRQIAHVSVAQVLIIGSGKSGYIGDFSRLNSSSRRS